MNTKTTNRMIAASGMAVVIAIGAAAFLRTNSVAPVAPLDTPAMPVAEAPAANANVVDQLPAAPAASGEAPMASPPVADDTRSHKDTKPSGPETVRANPVRDRDSARVDARSSAIAPAAPLAAVTDNAAPADQPNAVTSSDATPMPGGAPAVNTEIASDKISASDSEITLEVKSAIAGQAIAKDSSIAVSTRDGVVALSGNVPTQAAIDQVKDVAANVKDVKRVDTSGLIASL